MLPRRKFVPANVILNHLLKILIRVTHPLEAWTVRREELLHTILHAHHIQRTGVDKSAAIRLWGGVGGAKNKNMYTPLAPQTRRTAEY